MADFIRIVRISHLAYVWLSWVFFPQVKISDTFYYCGVIISSKWRGNDDICIAVNFFFILTGCVALNDGFLWIWERAASDVMVFMAKSSRSDGQFSQFLHRHENRFCCFNHFSAITLYRVAWKINKCERLVTSRQDIFCITLMLCCMSSVKQLLSALSLNDSERFLASERWKTSLSELKII